MALYVVGGGISPFIRPERKGETEEQRQQHSYVLSGGRAVKEALGDSCVSYEDVDVCFLLFFFFFFFLLSFFFFSHRDDSSCVGLCVFLLLLWPNLRSSSSLPCWIDG